MRVGLPVVLGNDGSGGEDELPPSLLSVDVGLGRVIID